MGSFSLKMFNTSNLLELPYLPFGISTIGIDVEGDAQAATGILCPKNKASSTSNVYLGYADSNIEDFQVLWGGGREQGLEITRENADKHLFLQLRHKGTQASVQTLSLMHSASNVPVCQLKLVPASTDKNVVKTKERYRGRVCFEGTMVPYYYPRWFPPTPTSSGKPTISYAQIKTPPIEIELRGRSFEYSTLSSGVTIFLGKKRLAEITGDLRYSWLHAELFTVFGDASFLVLRLWFGWTEKTNWSKLDYQNIECPDLERFDFVIDMHDEAVSWVGSDFHYREYWSQVDKTCAVKARILQGPQTISQSLVNLLKMGKPNAPYDPFDVLKANLKGTTNSQQDHILFQESVVAKGPGFLSKHVPNVVNGKVSPDLVSGVVSG